MLLLPISLLIIITIIATSTSNILRGVYSKNFQMNGIYLWRFNMYQNISCGISVLIIYIISKSNFNVSVFSVAFGLLLAVVNVLSIMSILKAQSTGPFAYTSVIVSLSAIIPTFSGVLFFKEQISAIQCVGVVLMIVCIILSPDKTSCEKKSASIKWLIYCGLAFIFSGAIGIIQKTHQHNDLHKEEMPVLLLTCFLCSTLISGVLYISQKTKIQTNQFARSSKKQLIIPVATGVCFSFQHSINLFLSGKISSVIFFPTVNLCPMIIIMLYAVIGFKEKLSAKRWIGIVIGIISTILVSGVIK